MKIKVIFEQYSIPHYRVPFFNELAKKVDLVVVASENPKKGGGVNDVRNATGFKNIRLEARPDSGLYHPGIIQVIGQENPDLIISWDTSLRLMMHHRPTLFLLKAKGIKTAWMGCDGYQVHNFTLGALTQFLPWRLARTLRELRAMKRVDHFIAHSSHMGNYLKKVKGVPDAKITLTNNAIDTSTINTLYQKWLAEGKERKPQGIIFVSRLIAGKNIETLFYAFAQIIKKYPEASLTVVGEGPLENTLRQLSNTLGIASKVMFVGGIYEDAILAEQLYANSLFILPGLGGLGFNTAMACGLPIIHSYADGTEEDLIEEGVNGWFFDGTIKDLVKKIVLAFSDPQKLKQMGKVSEERITRTFNLENMVKGYVSAIERITKK